MVSEQRVYPLLPVTAADLGELVGSELAQIERVDGGLTNTIHRVVLANGEIYAVKHYASGAKAYEDELTTLRKLAGILPVPEVIRSDDRRHAIVYRWMDGTTLDDCRRRQPKAAVASVAEPLGRLLAWMARIDAPGTWELAPILAYADQQLAGGRARERLGAPTSDALRRALETAADRLAWGALCLSHGDFGSRNVLVQHADGEGETVRWRIAGVIDWETMCAASPLVDIGGLFRYAARYDLTFRTDFERGYREADGELPDDWFRTARLLDATWLVDMLDEDRELPGIFADCRMLIGKLVAEYQ